MRLHIILCIGLAVLLSGCNTRSTKPTHLMRFHIETSSRDAGKRTRLAKLPVSGLSFTVDNQPSLFEGDIVNVELVQVNMGLCLFFQFTDRAARELYRLSVTHTKQALVLFVNDRAIGFQKLNRAIENGQLFMFVEVPDEDLPELIQNLKTSTKRVWEMKQKH